MKVLMHFLSELRRRKVIQTFIPFLGIIWLLLQVISVVTPLLNLSPFVATSLTIFLFACFPIVFYLSWYFDITTQGIKVTQVDDSDQPKQLGWQWWLGLAVIIIGSFMLGLHYFNHARTDFAKRSEGLVNTVKASSIAVLPFLDQSPNNDQPYLALGITAELAGLLGQVSGMQVPAASASVALSQQHVFPIDIAKRLQVETLLSGSVYSSGNRLRLRVELINAANGRTLWSESYSRELTEISAIKTEIARTVVNLLQNRYLPPGGLSNQSTTSSSDAYLIYLRGLEQYRLHTAESLKAARRLFEQAIVIDPDYALAYVALAETIILLAEGRASFGVLKADIAARLAEQHLAKALVRAPELAEAHAVRGLMLYYLNDDNDTALQALNKALSLNPNLAQAHLWRFASLERLGRSQDAWLAIQQAHRLDPVAIAHQYNLAFKLAKRGERAAASQQYQQLIAEFPASPMGYIGMANLNSSSSPPAYPMLNDAQADMLMSHIDLQLLQNIKALGWQGH